MNKPLDIIFPNPPSGLAPEALDAARIPEHIAVIMDGNGRWAKKRALNRLKGHKAGIEAVRETIRCASDLGVRYLTIYSFSTENWKRPQEEVVGLMDLFAKTMLAEVDGLHEEHVRVKTIGDLSLLPEETREAFEEAWEKTKNNTGMTLVVAVNYGSRQEILRAVNRCAEEVAARTADGLAPKEFSAEDFERGLYTAGMPDPDLVIRTSGEVRLSNFLLWQVAYSEFVVTDVLWPDFDRYELLRCLLEFQGRDRRFGAVKASLKAARATDEENAGPTRSTRIKDFAYKKTPQKLKNATDLQVRFRTGAIYVTLCIVCILVSDISTLVFLCATAGICAGEFYYMLRADAKLPNEMLGIIAAMLYPVSVYFLGVVGALYVSIALLLSLIVWYVFWLRARVPDVGVSFFGAAYTGLLLSGIVVVRTALPDPWGGVLVIGIFLSIWANDSFAYLVGSKIGKHKMAPRVSPKKSWEGFFAGIVGSMVIWGLFTLIPGLNLNLPEALGFGLVCGLMGVLGDLAESRIKRNSGFKDSGTIMPGHGGLLDRCGSLFLVAASSAILLVISGAIPFSV